MSITRYDFFSEVAKGVTNMRRKYVIAGFMIWSIAESNTEPCTSVNDLTPKLGAGSNPLNTTLFVPGATIFNTFGVKKNFHVYNYPDTQTGINATVSTLLESSYNDLVAVLKTRGVRVPEILKAIGDSPWGTSTEELVDVRPRYSADREMFNTLTVGK